MDQVTQARINSYTTPESLKNATLEDLNGIKTLGSGMISVGFEKPADWSTDQYNTEISRRQKQNQDFSSALDARFQELNATPNPGVAAPTADSISADQAKFTADQARIKADIAAGGDGNGSRTGPNPQTTPSDNSGPNTPGYNNNTANPGGAIGPVDPKLVTSAQNTKPGDPGTGVAAPGTVTPPVALPNGQPAPIVAPQQTTPQVSQPTLSINSPNQDSVRQLQSQLNIKSDGLFGPQTLAAVKAYQTAHGLVADGIVGPKTWASLNGTPDSSTVTTVASGAASGPAAPAPVSTGYPEVDSLIKTFNNQSPQKTYSDTYKEVYTTLGIPTMNATYTQSVQDLADLQTKKNEEMAKVNENPWISEGLRSKQIAAVTTKYEAKEAVLTNQQKLLETEINNARSDAQFVTGKIMDQTNQATKFNDDLIMKSIDIAEKSAEAEHALNKPIEVSPGASIYNPATKSVSFTAPKATTDTESLKNTVKTASSKLEAIRGTDGYVDPYIYKEVYDGFVNGFVDSSGTRHPALGTTSQFVSSFPPAQYVNPKAPAALLPSFLQNKSKTATRAL